jgi:hypothetical protein
MPEQGQAAPGWRPEDASELLDWLAGMTSAVTQLAEREGRLDGLVVPWEYTDLGMSREEVLEQGIGQLCGALKAYGEAWGLSGERIERWESRAAVFRRHQLAQRMAARGRESGE